MSDWADRVADRMIDLCVKEGTGGARAGFKVGTKDERRKGKKTSREAAK